MLVLKSFEVHTGRVPSLDAFTILDCMPAATQELTQFERGIQAAKVRNVSKVGSKISH